jgi:hypothetical protein
LAASSTSPVPASMVVYIEPSMNAMANDPPVT